MFQKILKIILRKLQPNEPVSQHVVSRKNMQDVLVHFKNLNFHPNTIIDVGVAYGTDGLYGQFDDVRYLLIEPLIEYESVCKKILETNVGDYVIAAASDKCGELTINVHPDLSGSSVFSESEGKHVDGDPRVVNCVTLDRLCTDKKLTGPFILKLDTQGAELMVLDGAKQTLKDTEIVIMEAFLFQFYKGIPLMHDIIAYMKQRGFVVYDVFGGINSLLDNALAQVDLVFVKEDGIFRLSNDFATRDQREAFKAERLRKINQDQ